MKNIENNVDLELKSIKSIDKNINKFYSSDENNSSFIDFHTNISQINLLDTDNQSDDTLNVVNKNMSNVNTTPNVINTNNSPTPNQDRVKKMPIEINIDAIDDDEYECVTYYEKAEIATPKIRKNDRGDNVKTLQNNLNSAINAKLKVDGICGDKTVSAIKKFQNKHKITSDGVYGPKTKSKMDKILN